MTSNLKHLLLSLLIITLTVQTVFGQRLNDEELQKKVTSTTGVLVGSIVNENGKYLEFATVYILRAADSLAIAYGITNAYGEFLIPDVPFGDFILKIDYIGYRPHYSSVSSISKSKPVLKLQKIKLDQTVTMLGSVEIKAQVEMLESNLDKKVFNVESSIISEGATAVEVLEEIPSVDVDLEGNVTLRGSENVTVLIDGRPTDMTLDQIPANLIESIEVITNPSARLEPDGMAGILNVVLKKRKQSGFNGMVSLRSSMYLFQNKPYFNNYNGNINLNYSYGNINVFLNYDFRSFGRKSAGTMECTSWIGEDSTWLYQDNFNDNIGYMHNVRTGIDWNINPKNTLSFSVSYNYNGRNSESELNVDNRNILQGAKTIFERYVQSSFDRNTRHNISSALNYKKVFKTKGQELTADVYYTQNMRSALDSSLQDYFDMNIEKPTIYQLSKTKDNNSTATAQVDFVTPVGQGGRIETGYKLSYRSIGEDYHLFSGSDSVAIAEDMTQSNHFVFSEMINAAYFIYSNTFWKKLKIQLGVRGEIANTKSDLKSADTAYYKNYYNLFPTVHIRYDINEQHSLQVSYSRRVTRPSIWQLNPFTDVSDKLNYRTGNPNLTPEFVNSFELAYLMTIKKSSFSFTGFYRQRDDIISRYTEIFQDTVENYTYTLTSYRNLNKSQNIGFELVYGQQLWKFWRFTLSGSFYRVIIDSKDLIDEYLTRDWSWNVRLNQTFNLPKDWSLQLNCRYRAPSLTTGAMGWGSGGIGQGKRSASYSVDFGVKKSFFKKSFVVSLNVRNLFSSYKTYVTTYSHVTANGYDAYSVRERPGMQISLTLSYKINNYKQRQEKQMEIEGEDME